MKDFKKKQRLNVFGVLGVVSILSVLYFITFFNFGLMAVVVMIGMLGISYLSAYLATVRCRLCQTEEERVASLIRSITVALIIEIFMMIFFGGLFLLFYLTPANTASTVKNIQW